MIKKQILDDFSSTMTGDSVMGSHTHKQPKKADSQTTIVNEGGVCFMQSLSGGDVIRT